MLNRIIYYLAGVFFIFAPLSVASDMDAAGPAKYVRLGTTALIVVCGLANGSLLRMGAATLGLLPFLVCWSVSPIWSSSPLWGLFYKGMFPLTFLSGAVLALSPRTLPSLDSRLRFLGIVSAAAALVVLYEYRVNPMGSTTHGRMSVGGLNANMLAQTAAPFAILCGYLALYSRRRGFRWTAGAGFALLIMILLLTGSRGGIMTALIGCGFLLLPLGKRPAMLLLVAGVVFGCAFVAVELLNVSEGIRVIDELGKDTRSVTWGRAFQRFMDRPLLGQGWLVQRGGAKWATVQSAYFQVLAETGVIGAGLLAVGILGLLPRLRRARRAVRNVPGTVQLWCLAAACIASGVFHGFVESALVIGTSLTPLMFGFGVGLLDQIPTLARSEAGSGVVQWRWVWVPGAPAGAELATTGTGPAGAAVEHAPEASGA